VQQLAGADAEVDARHVGDRRQHPALCGWTYAR
jgi:hypothetical protein